MHKCAFVSRHQPNSDQIKLATKAGFILVPVGDVDAFDDLAIFAAIQPYHAVCGVHPLVAIEACAHKKTWLQFNNVKRSAEGEPVEFGCSLLRVIEDGEDPADYTL